MKRQNSKKELKIKKKVQVPEDFAVRQISPVDPKATVCGDCGLAWDDSIITGWTPVPSGRCPFEYFHKD